MLGTLVPGLLGTVSEILDAGFEGEIRRPHDLNAGGAVIDAFEVAETVPAGSLSVQLRPVGGGRLTGSAPAGLAVTIGGALYTAAVAAVASGLAVELSLSTPLAASAGEGEAVDVADFAVFQLQGAVIGPAKERSLPEELRGVASATLTAPVEGNPVLPEREDIAVDTRRSRSYRVVSVPLEGAGIVECHLSTGGDS